MAFSLRSFAHSEVGFVRSTNQDSAYVSGTVLVVADGMGGAAAGDLASTVVVRCIADMDAALQPGDDKAAALREAVDAANDKVKELTAWNDRLEGMGTTVEAAVLDGTQLDFEHIGDSRAYLLRGGELRKLTKDHSWVQQMVDSGQLTEEEAEQHPNRSLVTRIVNGHEEFRPEFFTLDLKLGDRILLCSDGLSGQVDRADLKEMLLIQELPKVSNRLAKAARKAGAPDNVTFIVADVVAQDDALDSTPGRLFGAAKTMRIPELPGSTVNEVTVHIEGLVEREPTPQPEVQTVEPVVAPDETADVETSRPGRSRGGRAALIAIIALLMAVIGVGVFFAQRYLQHRYYLGPDGQQPNDEVVAVYQGVPDEIIGLSLSKVIDSSDIRIADLPKYYADQVRDLRLQSDTLEGVEQTLAELRALAEYCIAQREQSQSPTSTTTTPAQTSAGGKEVSPATTASASPTPVRPTATSAPTTPGSWECP